MAHAPPLRPRRRAGAEAATARPFGAWFIGGLWESYPDFGVRLHRSLRDRMRHELGHNVHSPPRRSGRDPAGGQRPWIDGPADLEGDQDSCRPRGPGSRATRSRPCGSVVSGGCSRSRTCSRPGFPAAPPAPARPSHRSPCVESGDRMVEVPDLSRNRPRHHRVDPPTSDTRSDPALGPGRFHGGLSEVLKRPGGGANDSTTPTSAMRPDGDLHPDPSPRIRDSREFRPGGAAQPRYASSSAGRFGKRLDPRFGVVGRSSDSRAAGSRTMRMSARVRSAGR